MYPRARITRQLNPAKLTDEEKQTVKQQIEAFHCYESLIEGGDYYRLDEGEEDYTAWMVVSPDQSEALVSLVVTHVRSNGKFPFVRLQGLKADAVYRREDTGETVMGAALLQGISFGQMHGDYPAAQVRLKEMKNEK